MGIMSTWMGAEVMRNVYCETRQWKWNSEEHQCWKDYEEEEDPANETA